MQRFHRQIFPSASMFNKKHPDKWKWQPVGFAKTEGGFDSGYKKPAVVPRNATENISQRLSAVRQCVSTTGM